MNVHARYSPGLHGSETADIEMQGITSSIEFEHTVSEATWKDMSIMLVLRVTVLGMAVQFFQQSTGTNSLLYTTLSVICTAFAL